MKIKIGLLLCALCIGLRAQFKHLNELAFSLQELQVKVQKKILADKVYQQLLKYERETITKKNVDQVQKGIALLAEQVNIRPDLTQKYDDLLVKQYPACMVLGLELVDEASNMALKESRFSELVRIAERVSMIILNESDIYKSPVNKPIACQALDAIGKIINSKFKPEIEKQPIVRINIRYNSLQKEICGISSLKKTENKPQAESPHKDNEASAQVVAQLNILLGDIKRNADISDAQLARFQERFSALESAIERYKKEKEIQSNVKLLEILLKDRVELGQEGYEEKHAFDL